MLEEIVGEIEDEFDENDAESSIYTLADGSQRVAGDATIAAVNEAFDVAAADRRVRHHRRPGRARARPRAAARRVGDDRRPGVLGDAHARRRGALVQGHARRRRGARVRRRLSAADGAHGVPSAPGCCAAALAARRAARQPSPSSPTLTLWPLQMRRRSRCSPGASAARRTPRRAARSAWLFGTAWLVRRHLVAVRQHAPLRRPAGVARGAGGARAGGVPLALPRRGDGARRALAAAAPRRAALLFAAAWLLAELARGVIFTGFPWVASGYAHVDAPLAGLAPWLGVYGIGAVARRRWPPASASRRCAVRAPGCAPGGGARRRARRRRAARPGRLHAADAARSRSRCCRATCRRTRSSTSRLVPEALACDRGADRWPRAAISSSAPETVIPLLPSELDAEPTGTRLLAHFRAARPGRAASACRWATTSVGYTNSALGLSAASDRAAGRLLPLRQAPPGAVRRVRPDRLPLVHAA